MIHQLANLNATAITGILAAAAALVGAVTAFIKFGLGERGTLTITQAQGANTILDASLKALERQLERVEQDLIDCKVESAQKDVTIRTLRAVLESNGFADPT